MPTHYLYEFTKNLRKDYTHHQNRLTDFYHGDVAGPFLTRPARQFAGYQARYQHLVYDLAPRAKAVLAGCGVFDSGQRARSGPFIHQLMLACVGASIELTCPRYGVEYISLDHILAHERCPRETRTAPEPLALSLPGMMGRGALIPDGLFGIRYPGVGYRFYALEVDRGTESIKRRMGAQTAFRRKIDGYDYVMRRLWFREQWGLPNLHVLTVTTSNARAHNLAALVQQRVHPSIRGRFTFAVEQSFGSNWHVPSAIPNFLLDSPIWSPRVSV